MTRAGDDAAHAAPARCAAERPDAYGLAISQSERVQWPVANAADAHAHANVAGCTELRAPRRLERLAVRVAAARISGHLALDVPAGRVEPADYRARCRGVHARGSKNHGHGRDCACRRHQSTVLVRSHFGKRGRPHGARRALHLNVLVPHISGSSRTPDARAPRIVPVKPETEMRPGPVSGSGPS